MALKKLLKIVNNESKNEAPLMKCGHVAIAIDNQGTHYCPMCAGINEGYNIIDDNPPDLKNRRAICHNCGETNQSSFNLPFFEYRPTVQFDGFYDGCRGWN